MRSLLPYPLNTFSVSRLNCMKIVDISMFVILFDVFSCNMGQNYSGSSNLFENFAGPPLEILQNSFSPSPPHPPSLKLGGLTPCYFLVLK